MPDRSIWLAREHGETAARGEVVVGSRYLALGLWQNGRLEPGRMRQDPDDPSVRILHTGDVIHLREDGPAEIVGRKDRQVKVRGLRVHPSEVEDALCRCDGVSEAVVTTRPDDESGAALIAYVVPSRAVVASFFDDLQAAMAELLPGHMRPAHFRIVDKIPLLPNFKPDLVALERSSWQIAPEAAVQAKPKTSTATNGRVKDAIAGAWTQILGPQSFTESARWQDAGGNSLKKLRLWVGIEKALRVRLRYEAFDDRATPDDIAAAVERALAATAGSTVGLPTAP
jgi:hypothetical protein